METIPQPAGEKHIERTSSEVPDTEPLFLRRLNDLPPHMKTYQEELACAKAIEAGLFAREKLECFVYAPEFRQDLQTIAERGDAAFNHFVMSGILLSRSIANKYISVANTSYYSRMDLYQDAHIGLIRAVRGWDYAKGNRFSSYAKLTISGTVMKALSARQTGDHHDYEFIQAFRNTQNALQERLGRAATYAEIEDELGWNADQRRRHRTLMQPTIDVNGTVPWDGSGIELGDVLVDDYAGTPEDVLDSMQEPHQIIHTVCEMLDERSARILLLRHGLIDGQKRQIKEIGEQEGIHFMTVSRIIQKAYKVLRTSDELRALLNEK